MDAVGAYALLMYDVLCTFRAEVRFRLLFYAREQL
jgi:hypothetical protein